MLHPSEIQVGLVLRMDPYRLLDFGSEATTDGWGRVWTPHWFICIERRGDVTLWLSTSSKWAPERRRVTRKWGQPVWTDAATYADLYQVWEVKTFFALRAAANGVDPSRQGFRNYAHVDFACDAAVAA